MAMTELTREKPGKKRMVLNLGILSVGIIVGPGSPSNSNVNTVHFTCSFKVMTHALEPKHKWFRLEKWSLIIIQWPSASQI